MKNPSVEQTISFGVRALSKTKGRPCKGFTLLEVMVAMLLLAVIMTTSVTMLFVNLKGWEGLTEHSDEVLQEQLIGKRVVSMIQHMAPLVWRNQKQRLLALNGESQRFQFVSRAPRQHRAGGLFEYLLVQEAADDQGLSLVLYIAPFDPNATGLSLPENARRRVLINGLQDMEFAYFGSKQNRENSAWHNDWEPGLMHYPDLVRLSLRHTGAESVKEHYIRIRQDYPMIVQQN